MKGEGVMLREPGTYYQPGRSNTLKKYKGYFETEVRYIKSISNQKTTNLLCEQYVFSRHFPKIRNFLFFYYFIFGFIVFVFIIIFIIIFIF